MVTLPFNLGGIIRDSIDAYRRQNNIPEPDEVKSLSVHRRRDTFLEEEFKLVREITIDKESIKYIDLFPNITSLTIDGIAELDGVQFKHIIDKYPNLENLTIKGQEQLQFLDVSKMKNLKHLELVSNHSLHRVVGLDKIDSLEQLTFYDNSTYLKEDELCEIVSKLSQNGTHCNLDVLYMPTMNQIGISNPQNFNWCESVGLGIYGDELKYETKELEEAVKKTQEIVSQYIRPTDTTIQKYAILYQWMCENVRYDYESLDSDHIHKEQGKSIGQLGGTNGTVNGLVYRSCICEGYSKSMQMLLKLCGIPSFDVSCITEDPKKIMPSWDGKKKMHVGNHSILKVNIDGKCYYSDVTWDANNFQHGEKRQYFLLSKKDITSDHKLVGEDRVFAALKSISSQEFQELMKFAQERMESVNKKLEEKAKMKKTPQERLTDINKQLEQLRQQYGVIGKQIEDLMIKNQKSPIPNYQEQLAKLTSQRDTISASITTKNSSKKTYEWIVQNERETEHKNKIAQVERLLGIHITSNAGFVYDNELQVPRSVSKDTATLRREQGAINKELEQLYYDGELDLKTYNSMKMEVLREYDSMVAKAPKPTKSPTRDESSFTQQQEQNPTPVQHPYINPDIRKKVEERADNNKKEAEINKELNPFPLPFSKVVTTSKPKDCVKPPSKEEEKIKMAEKLNREREYERQKQAARKAEEAKRQERLKQEQEKQQKQNIAIEQENKLKQEKEKLEAERRELRRKQFLERERKMNLNRKNTLSFDDLINKSQELEQENIQEMEQEEDLGMQM